MPYFGFYSVLVPTFFLGIFIAIVYSTKYVDIEFAFLKDSRPPL